MTRIAKTAVRPASARKPHPLLRPGDAIWILDGLAARRSVELSPGIFASARLHPTLPGVYVWPCPGDGVSGEAGAPEGALPSEECRYWRVKHRHIGGRVRMEAAEVTAEIRRELRQGESRAREALLRQHADAVAKLEKHQRWEPHDWRSQHQEVTATPSGTAGEIIRSVQSPIDRYLARKIVTMRQYAAARTLFKDYELGICGARDPDAKGGGGTGTPISEAQIMAAEAYGRAVRFMGKRLSAIVLPIVCEQVDASRLAERMGERRDGVMAILRMGLDSLQDFYVGMDKGAELQRRRQIALDLETAPELVDRLLQKRGA